MKPEFDREIDALLRSRAGGGKASTREGGTSAPGGRSRGEIVRGEVTNDDASVRERARARHLDADELAAFAEGALPDAARTRYVAHLADCDECRRTATLLALASGVFNARDGRESVAAVATSEAVAAEKVKKGSDAEKSVALSWRGRVAAFFAPSAWRYAMPVVALLCVGVIALVVLRRAPNAASQLARNDEEARTNSTSAASTVASDQNHATATDDQPAEVSTKTQPQGGATSASAVNDKARPQAGEREQVASSNQAPSQAAGNTAGGGTGGALAGAASSASSGPANTTLRRADDLPVTPTPAAAPMIATKQAPEAQPRPSLAAQATPAPLPPPASAETDRLENAKDENARQTEAAAEREQPKARRARTQGREATAGAAAPRAALRNEPDANASASGNANSADKEERKRAARDEKKSDEDRAADSARTKSVTGEARSVAGRRFRREGDAWIDTAYHGGAATVVRRGSEQYRALVADEPEIGRVASSLGGEVVVVWKGRAYRIKP